MTLSSSQSASVHSHSAPSRIECRTFKNPDDKLDFGEFGKIDIIQMHDGEVGMHAVLEPGYKWSIHEKPLLGNPESCPMPHTGYCIAGEIAVRMIATKQEHRIRRGDFFVIPPGHDAYVLGAEPCELILFAPAHPPT